MDKVQQPIKKPVVKLSKDQQVLLKLMRVWRLDPLAWVLHFFPEDELPVSVTGHRGFSSQQKQGWMELGKLIRAKLAVADGRELTEEEAKYAKKIGISIMSGNGTGKDAWMAITIWYFLSVFPNPRLPCTAPSMHQLKDVLWSELAKWMRLSRKTSEAKSVLGEWHEWQGEKVFLKEKKGKEAYAVARSVNVKASDEEQAETLAGFHEDYMVFMIDEASGVPDPVFRPIEGTLTGKLNIAILIFNPTRGRGYAIRTQNEDAGRWVNLRWNGEESELVSKNYIQTMEEKYGRESNTFRIRILGLPPIADGGTLIPADWIQDAIKRDLEPRPTDPIIKTADFGAGGDKSVICTRRGGKIFELKRKQTPDSNILTDWVIADLIESEADAFGGDVIGIGWAVMGNVRKRAPRKTMVRSIDSRGNARDKKRFLNNRAEMYWKLREDFENGEISIPNDQDLIDQLNAIRYDTNDRSQTFIIKKAIIRKDLNGESPDEADSVAMSKFFDMEALQRQTDDYDKDEKWHIHPNGKIIYNDSRSFMRA